MIIAFETESSPTLDRFSKNFIEPDSIWKKFIHSYAYTTKSFNKVNDTYIFEFNSFMDVISKRALIVGVSMFFMSYILGWKWLIFSAIISMLLSMTILSKSIRELLFMLELKRGGHKAKINFLSIGSLCSLLLFKINEVNDGKDPN